MAATIPVKDAWPEIQHVPIIKQVPEHLPEARHTATHMPMPAHTSEQCILEPASALALLRPRVLRVFVRQHSSRT